MWPTVSAVEILKMEGKLATSDDIPVKLIKRSHSCEFWSWKTGERAEIQPPNSNASNDQERIHYYYPQR